MTESTIDKVLDRMGEFLFPEQKYCNLSAMARFEMRDVQIVQDRVSLQQMSEPNYLIIRYKGWHVATAYENGLERAAVGFTNDRDQERLEEVWRLLGSYYS